MIRYLKTIVLMFLVLSSISNKAQTKESDKYQDGVKITYTRHFECYSDDDCNQRDSIQAKELPGSKWTIYYRGDQIRLEHPDNQWDYNGTSVKIYPGKSELNSFSCFDSKYFKYYTEVDSTMDQLYLIDESNRLPYFEELGDSMIISDFKCKSGIIHDTYNSWFVYYTDDIDKVKTPHKLELSNFSSIQHITVPHFIIYRKQVNEGGFSTKLASVETIETVQYLKLHDSLFIPPSNYIKFKNEEAAKEEHMKFWDADLKKQMIENPLSTEDREAYYGHWIYTDDNGSYYLNIQPNESKDKYGDTCFVKDFMIRKNERSSGTIGNWKTKMMGATLFHEFGRSWTFDKKKDELVLNSNDKFRYRRASEVETSSSLRECDLIWAAWDMADSLDKWGYAKVLVENDGLLADSLWNMIDGEEILKRVAYRSGSSRNQRFIAAEIIFRKDVEYPPQEDKNLLHNLSYAYANALSYDYAPSGEYWGSLADTTTGICGEHLLKIGATAISELKIQTLNQEFDFYLDYESRIIGTMYGPRKKDYAAFYISRLLNEPYVFKKEKADRNTDIEILRQKIKVTEIKYEK